MANLITPIGVLSYPNLYVPKAMKGESDDKAKYSANIVWTPKADKAEQEKQLAAIKALNNGGKEAAVEKWPKDGETIYAKQKHQPFKHVLDAADAEKTGFPIGTIILSCKANKDSQPGVVSRYAGKDGKPVPITDPKEMYPGCLVRFSVRPYAWQNEFGKGVSFGLGNVQRMGEGERLDGRKAAADEFDGEEAPPADDLLG